VREVERRGSVRQACRVVAFAILVLLSACNRPPSIQAEGQVVQHGAGFEVTVPDGWQVTESRAGLAVVRMTPYGGGFPTLHVRRVDRAEADALAISGSSRRLADTETTFRYRAWSNSRGRGYRLDALLQGSRGILVTEASIWDSSTSLNRRLFDEEFWPIINSIVDRGPAAPVR
jgi:hypothetical protein